MISYDTTIMQTAIAGHICKVVKQLIVAVNSKPYHSDEDKEAISAGKEVLLARADALKQLRKRDVYFKKFKKKGEKLVKF